MFDKSLFVNWLIGLSEIKVKKLALDRNYYRQEFPVITEEQEYIYSIWRMYGKEPLLKILKEFGSKECTIEKMKELMKEYRKNN